MFLTRFALRNPVAVTLFYVLIGLVGLLALVRMGRSILPPISLPVVSIQAPYPGAGPRDVERLIIQPIEDQLAGLPDVSQVNASAQSGIGVIVVQFRFGSILATDRANVQQAVDAARQNLPADLVPPVVSKGSLAQTPVLDEALSSPLLSQAQLAQLVAREMLPVLREAGGVGGVQTSGEAVRQFVVEPREQALDGLGITPLDVFRSVAAGNDLFSGGTLRSPIRESSISVDAAVVSAAQIASLPLTTPNGAPLRIGDVARVYDTLADPTTVARVDGDPAVLLYVSPAQGADPTRVIASARAALAKLARQYPRIRFQELRTDESATNAAIGGVLQTLGEGIVLTVLVMLLFLHAWRNAFIAAISIPSSLCAAFITMWLLGFSLNVLSLMGLSLTIGILVDDSIVIIEAIARAASSGLNPDRAALKGREDLGGAAFAITLVDVAVFLPIGLMNGIVGEFMREFGLVIVFATAFSLLASFTITPLLVARWALAKQAWPLEGLAYRGVLDVLQSRARTFPWTFRGRPVLAAFAAWHTAINAFNAWEARMSEAYAQRWLRAAMRRRKAVFAIAGAACAIALTLVMRGTIPAEFSPPVNRGELSFDLVLPAGTPLEQTDAAASRLAMAVLDDARVAHVESSAGRSSNGSTDIFASNVAQLRIVLSDPNGDSAEIERRIRSLASVVPAARIIGGGKGMGGAPAVSYTIGGDPSQIDLAASRIAQVLRSNPYATDVRTSNLGVEPSVRIALAPGALTLLGVSADDAAQTARIASGGSIATRARLPDGLVDVVVRSDAARAGDLDRLRSFTVRSVNGVRVPLDALTRTAFGTQPVVLEREDGRRIVSVTANGAGGSPISLLTGPVKRALRDPNFLPQGTYVVPRGDIEQFLDTASRILAALALSVLAVYVILAILYRSYTLPFVVMFTVPLASIGAFGSLYVANALRFIFPDASVLQAQTLNLYSMLGIVMLVGLVAKNGILLVDYAERAVREGADAFDAMVAAAQARFRPILMTTFAMIAGMLPLALGHTAGAEYRKALGTVVIGGLSTSLLLTLFVVPLAYAAFRRRAVGGKQTRLVHAEQPMYTVR